MTCQLAVMVAVLVALIAGPAAAQPSGLIVNPVMSKGPAAPPVTIVEFSDYQ